MTATSQWAIGWNRKNDLETSWLVMLVAMVGGFLEPFQQDLRQLGLRSLPKGVGHQNGIMG